MSLLKGTFQITSWDENVLTEQADGCKLSQAKVTQKYTGAIEGESEVHYFMSYLASGNAEFVGFETIKRTDKAESILLRHVGEFVNGVASSHFVVIDETKSNAGELEGSGYFESGEQGCAEYQITLP
ncbi:MAG: DUF3224 domain-containing protein [Parashewanella sp.]